MPITLQDQAAVEMLQVLREIRAAHLPAGALPKPGTMLARVVQAIQRAEASGIRGAPAQLAIPLAREPARETAPKRDSKPSRHAAEPPRRRRRVQASEADAVTPQDVMIPLPRAVEMLGVSESTIYRWARGNAVRTVRAADRTQLYALADLKRIAAL